MNSIFNVLDSVKGNTILSIDYVSPVRMNKGGRSHSNTLYDRKVERETKTQFQFGNVYENSVNNRAEKEQGEKTNFESEAPKGKRWVKFPYFLESLSNGEIYVRFYKMKNAKAERGIFVDGIKANEEELVIISQYEIKPSSFSYKQAESGLTENQVEVRDIKLSNIREIVVNGVKVTA